MSEQLYLHTSSGCFYTKTQNDNYEKDAVHKNIGKRFVSTMIPVTEVQLLTLYKETLNDAIQYLGVDKYQEYLQRQISNMQ
jgi:hypothetical protein